MTPIINLSMEDIIMKSYNLKRIKTNRLFQKNVLFSIIPKNKYFFKISNNKIIKYHSIHKAIL
jgi:hypothetical protein